MNHVDNNLNQICINEPRISRPVISFFLRTRKFSPPCYYFLNKTFLKSEGWNNIKAFETNILWAADGLVFCSYISLTFWTERTVCSPARLPRDPLNSSARSARAVRTRCTTPVASSGSANPVSPPEPSLIKTLSPQSKHKSQKLVRFESANIGREQRRIIMKLFWIIKINDACK